MDVPIAAPMYETPVTFPRKVNPADTAKPIPKFFSMRFFMFSFCSRAYAPTFSVLVSASLSISLMSFNGSKTTGLSAPSTLYANRVAYPAVLFVCASNAS